MKTVQNCSGQTSKISGEFFPETTDDVIEIVRKAQRENLKLHPVSTGRNWGYGTSSPFDDHSYIINLSKMNKILEFNPELRVVRIQPGVTQKQLSQYLEDHGYDFLVPTTGAGETVSILGNTLERGYGLTPWVDHFSSLTSIQAVLPDGTLYQSPLAEIGCKDISSAYKWGLGPYLDGLFSQGNFGIITEATICLQPRPERVSFLLAGAGSFQELRQAVQEIKTLMGVTGGLIAGVNYINSLRTASMMRTCPEKARLEKRSLSHQEVQSLEEELGLSPWNIIVTLYGPRNLLKTLEKDLKKKLHFLSRSPMVFSNKSIERLGKIFQKLPLLKSTKTYLQFEKLRDAYSLINGRPSNMAHNLTHWRTSLEGHPKDFKLDESKIGLMWYAPLIPLTAKDMKSAVDMIGAVTNEYGFDPLITLTATNDRYTIATLALSFSRESSEEIDRAQRCYQKLCIEGQKIGIFPYRSGTLVPPLFPGAVFSALNEKLRQVLDPHGILDPGRHKVVLKKTS